MNILGVGMRKLLPLTMAVMSAFAWANEVKEETVDLGTVEVTANRLGGQKESVGADKILVRQPQSMGDILRDVAGVQVGHPSALGQRFKIRGLEDQFINVTIDGARQEGYHFHHAGSYGLDPELLKRVNINVGSNSITYDAGALGGAMNFETADASDLLAENQTFGGKAKLGYASNGKEFQKSLALYGRAADKLDLLAYVNHRNMDYYKSGNGEKIPNDGYLLNYLLKAKFDITDEQYVRLSAEKYRNTAETNTRLNFGQDVNAGDQRKYEMDRETYSLSYGYTPVDNNLIDFKANVYSTQQTSTHQKSIDGSSGGTDTIVKTQGVKLRNESAFETGALAHRLIAGLEYYDSKASIDNASYNHAQLERGKSTSLYLEDQIRIDNFTITPGIRWDRYRYDTINGKLGRDMNAFDKTYTKFSKALGLRYDFTPNFAAFANYTELFRGPSGKDLGMGYSYNNNNLKATTGYNTEIGVTGSLSNLLANEDRFSATAKLFNTQYKDFVTVLAARKLDNIPKARLRGAELAMNYRYEGFKAHLGVSKVSNKITQGNDVFVEGAEFEPSIGDTYTLGVSYSFVDQSLELGWNSRFIRNKSSYGYDGRGAMPMVDVQKRGYGVSDIYVAWTPKTGTFKGADFVFGVDNVFNKQYNDHSYYLNTSKGQSEKGRNVKATVAYKF